MTFREGGNGLFDKNRKIDSKKKNYEKVNKNTMPKILILILGKRFLMNKKKIKLLSIKNSFLTEEIRIFTCLVWFYGISTIVGYLMPNSLYTCILDTWFVNTFSS